MLRWHATRAGQHGGQEARQWQAQAVSNGKGSGIRHPSPSSSVRIAAAAPERMPHRGQLPNMSMGTCGPEGRTGPSSAADRSRVATAPEATQQLHERCDGEGVMNARG